MHLNGRTRADFAPNNGEKSESKPRHFENGAADGYTDRKEMIGMTYLDARFAELPTKKPSVRVGDTDDMRLVARDIVHGTDSWIPQAPDAIVTFISGHSHFDKWRRDDFRSALHYGIGKLMNTLKLVVFDDGLNYGLSKIVGDIAREDERLNAITSVITAGSTAIGVVPVCRLRSQDYPFKEEAYDSAMMLKKEKDLEVPLQLSLNQNHADYIYLANQSYGQAALTRVLLEKAVQEELVNRGPPGPGQSSLAIPLVAFLFQGELDDLERVKAYIKNGVLVIVMEGAGGLGDIIAGAICDSVEMDDARLRISVDQRLRDAFSPTKQSAKLIPNSVDLVLDILQASRGEVTDQSDVAVQLLSVINCGSADTFGNLNSAVLTSAIKSSSATSELFSSFMSLAVKCNDPDVAISALLSKRPWSNMELNVNTFEMALLLPGREKFVEFYLLQKFSVGNYLSHLKLLKLFREASDPEFFKEHVWEGIMLHSLSQPVGPGFISDGLNRLIFKLTGIYDYIDAYDLSANAFGEKTAQDSNTAERKAMNALLVFAALFNRPHLVRILIKYSSEPLVQAIFAESLFHGLYKHVPHIATSENLKTASKEFSQIAVELLDFAIADSPVEGLDVLTRTFSDFNDKTPLEMAYDTNNKEFVAHPTVQSWLNLYFLNFIKVKGTTDNLKLFLSAVLIFPMYMWLSFPRLRKAPMSSSDNVSQEFVFRPQGAAEIEKVLSRVKRIQAGKQNADYTAGTKMPFPPFLDMLKAVWAAPMVRFYTTHLFYWMFLILICVDIMLPPCRFIAVDLAVWVITSAMWLEVVMRTMYDVQRYRRFAWYVRAYDLICQTVFNILFFLYRICPYRYDHPFAGRVILAFGVWYYTSRVWGWFYYLEKTIGPNIRIAIRMFTIDLSRWIVLVAPFMISTTVIFMGVQNPDWPATGDDWRHAFYRGIFTLFFGGFDYELEYNADCEADRTTTNNHPPWRQPGAIPVDRCWSGNYNSYSCPTVSFWAYFFLIQYNFFLQLGLVNMLSSFFVDRMFDEVALGPAVWRYHRCRIILDYATRTSLPPPFPALGYLYKMMKYCLRPNKSKGVQLRSDASSVGDSSADSCVVWRSLAMAYFRRKEEQELAASVPQQQLDMLAGIQNDVAFLNRKLTATEQTINGVGAQRPVPLAVSSILSQIAQPVPHVLARSSPYPGTTIIRSSVPDNRCDWTEVFRDYRPATYNSEGYPTNQNIGQPTPLSWATCLGQASPVRYLEDDNGFILNPSGRTGLKGRGSLPKWGPNQKICVIITSRRKGGFRYVTHRVPDAVKILPQAFLEQGKSAFAVGCQILDAFLNDSKDLDPNFDDQDLQFLEEMQEDPRTAPLRELYKGYCDSSLNTDNAWMETAVFHLKLPPFKLDRFKHYQWNSYAREEILNNFEGAIIRQIAVEYNI